MEINFKNIILLLLLGTVFGCSKKNENYLSLVGDEIHYPGVISKTGFKAGKLRAQLFWNPSPDPNIKKYVIYWNNKLDSMVVNADSHNTSDTVKVTINNLKESSYAFIVYSYDHKDRISIPININGVRVFGQVYQSGIFNRGYDADHPYEVDIPTGTVKLKFNTADSININTLIKYTNNAGQAKTINLSPDSTYATLKDFKFGTAVTYQSSYIPLKGAIDVFTVTNEDTYPTIKRIGDITALYIKNAGSPFLRSDNGSGKWGLPKDWQYNSNVVNQNNSTGGGWSSDNGGVIHFESKDWGGDGVNNGKIYQSFTLPAGKYAVEYVTQGNGGTIDANLVVAAGTTLPDITQLENNVLARYHGDNNSIGGTHTINFTLSQPTTVAVGWVVNTGSYTYLQFKSIKLRSID